MLFVWVCAAYLSEPLPHYTLFCGQLSTPILVHFGDEVTTFQPQTFPFFWSHPLEISYAQNLENVQPPYQG